MTHSRHEWRVVPLSPGQLLDVSPADVLVGGHFRKCSSYRGGGGYDRFPLIAEKYLGEPGHHLQFVVQLYGCNLDCPYCYVTRQGVWGGGVEYATDALVRFFNETECTVFHLMGGAPALSLEHWPELIDCLEESGKPGWVFHSDLMLSESDYDVGVLAAIAVRRALYAVSIKGVAPAEYYCNTRRRLNEHRMWRNLERLEAARVPYYVTFTNVRSGSIEAFWSHFSRQLGTERAGLRRADAFQIALIEYHALSHVDAVSWGGEKARRKVEPLSPLIGHQGR